MTAKKKVLIAIPNDGWIHQAMVDVAFRILTDPHGYEVSFTCPPGRPLEHNRNLIVKAFLEMGADFLLMIDADNPPLRNPLDLVELDKDIMILPTPIWFHKHANDGMGRVPIRLNIYNYEDGKKIWREREEAPGLVEVDAGGSGCLLVARRVLEVVRPAFMREFNADGIDERGSDLLFCLKAKEAGFKVWAHYDYPCHHLKEVDLLDVRAVLYERDVRHAQREDVNTPTYWDQEWPKRVERILPVYPLIVDMVRGKSVIDYGCGRGDLLAMLDSECPTAWGVDQSEEAVRICTERGLKALRGEHWPRFDRHAIEAAIGERCDVVVSTEVLEHVDDDAGLLAALHTLAPLVIYSVPHDCLPPGLEREHRRIYTEERVRSITPHLESVTEVEDYLLVVSRGG